MDGDLGTGPDASDKHNPANGTSVSGLLQGPPSMGTPTIRRKMQLPGMQRLTSYYSKQWTSSCESISHHPIQRQWEDCRSICAILLILCDNLEQLAWNPDTWMPTKGHGWISKISSMNGHRGTWPYLKEMFHLQLQQGHLADTFIQSDLHRLIHTLTNRRQSQPCKATGAVRVKCLAQGHIDTQLAGAGDWTISQRSFSSHL